jgi:hypothetical protein
MALAAAAAGAPTRTTPRPRLETQGTWVQRGPAVTRRREVGGGERGGVREEEALAGRSGCGGGEHGEAVRLERVE